MCLIFLTFSLFLLVSMLHFIVCSSIDTPLYWFTLGLLFTTVFSVYVGFWPKFTYIHGFLAKSCIYMQVFGQNPGIHAAFWPKVAYICSCSLNSCVHPPFWLSLMLWEVVGLVVSVVGSSLGLMLFVGCLFCDQGPLFH